jgi:hypothetical protein
MKLAPSRRARWAATVLVAATPACGGGTAPLPAPGAASETAAFVVTLGADTIALEQYTRTAERLEGELVVLTPRVVTRTYTAELRPDGSISRLRVYTRTPAAAAALPQVVTTDYSASGASVRVERGDTVRTFEVAAEGAVFPWIMNSFALTEQSILHLLADPATRTAAPPHLPVGATQVQSVTLTRAGPDSVIVETFVGPTHLRLDGSGRIIAASSPESTQKIEAARVDGLNLAALTADAVRRELAGAGLGVLSPRDSVTARIGDATVSVAYGRPARRGRDVFPDVVPWGQVWRTGANQATHFYTDADLEVGGTPVPAGAYSLFTLPSPTQWLLIVNQQTGQWGTAYDASRDLARIPMQRRTLTERVETFTIRIEPGTGAAGRLVMAWDDVEVAVNVRSR